MSSLLRTLLGTEKNSETRLTHIHAETLDYLEVVDHGFQRRRCVNAVWPVSLVEWAKEKLELAVEQGPLDPIDLAGGDGPEARVALDLVFAHLDSHVVQSRRIRRPEVRRRNLQSELVVRDVLVLGDHIAIRADNRDFDWCRVLGLAVNRDGQLAVHVAGHVKARDEVVRDALKPDSAPNARAWRVEDVGQPLGLLALGDALIIRRVEDVDNAESCVSSLSRYFSLV